MLLVLIIKLYTIKEFGSSNRVIGKAFGNQYLTEQ